MASVTLARIYLHTASDLADHEKFWSDQPAESLHQAGEIRTYAGGRRRIITRAVRTQTIGISLLDVSDDQKAWLELHMGDEMVYRDPQSRIFGGAYFDIDPSDYPDGSGWEVALTFEGSTWSAEV